MNKTRINEHMEAAYVALAESGIAQNGKVKKTFRGQVSSFGAAITMGSLCPAIAFFSDEGGSSVDRTKIMKAIYMILKPDAEDKKDKAALYKYATAQKAAGNENACKEEILNAAIALKLAMNLYILER